MHEMSLVTTLVSAFGLALIFGYMVERYAKMPALLGYVLAGMSVSVIPGLPKVDSAVTSQLAEVGVMLLMFGVGLHFSPRDLLKVKSVAIPGALGQMALSSFLGACFASVVWDWSLTSSIVFGLTLSCASTVVLTKALEMQNLGQTPNGQVAMGWLIVQDLVTVVILVLIPMLSPEVARQSTGAGILQTLAMTLSGVLLFAFLMLGGGRWLFPLVLRKVAQTGSRELFTLAVLALALGIAYMAGALFNVSYALGAFFAGMVIRESRYARRAAQNSLPLQDAFAVLFFVSVGLLLDWHVFIEDPYEILSVVAIVMLGTTSVSFGLVLLCRWPLQTALIVASSLAQLGEFSFIVASQGIALGLADPHMMRLLVAGSIITIALNPVLFRLIPTVTHKLVTKFNWARRAAMREMPFSTLPPETPRTRLGGQVVVIGDHPTVEALLRALTVYQYPIIWLSRQRDVEDRSYWSDKISFLMGEPTDPMTLVQAHIMSASIAVLIGDNVAQNQKVISLIKELNPGLSILVHASTMEDAELLRQNGVTVINDVLAVSYALAGSIHNVMQRKRKAKRASTQGLPEDRDDRPSVRSTFEAIYPKMKERARAHEKRLMRESR